MKKHTKTDRHNMLKTIISNADIKDQVQLQKELHKQGLDVTQATISRDLHEIGVVKIRVKHGMYKYAILEKTSKHSIWNQLKLFFENFVIDIKSSNNLMIIKTTPGNAIGIVCLIDGMEKPEILGTIAGYDTALIILDTNDNLKILKIEFEKILETAS